MLPNVAANCNISLSIINDFTLSEKSLDAKTKLKSCISIIQLFVSENH